MDPKDNTLDTSKRISLPADLAEQARKVAAEIPDALRKAHEASLDEREQNQIAQWTAICNEHTTAIGPLQTLIDPSMNEKVLNALWDCNQKFLRQIAGF